jgi:hypothetical protein
MSPESIGPNSLDGQLGEMGRRMEMEMGGSVKTIYNLRKIYLQSWSKGKQTIFYNMKETLGN